jgi:FlaA1/EpsC-like NDP-sugar epimerase
MGKRKQWALFFGDVFFLYLSGLLALFLRFDGSLTWITARAWILSATIAFPLLLLGNRFFGLYTRLWAYATLRDMWQVVKAMTVLSFALYLIITFGRLPISLGVQVLIWGILLCGVSGLRLSLKAVHERLIHAPKLSPQMERTLVLGAGLAGQMLVKELERHPEMNSHIVGFLDDDANKQKMFFLGYEVLGEISDLPEIVQREKISRLILAIPSASGDVSRRIRDLTKGFKLKIQTVPALYDLVGKKAAINDLRPIQLEDLLRRKPIQLDHSGMLQVYGGKRILVTGAGGSIGSEICRQLMGYDIETLILLGRGENSIYQIHRELRELKDKVGYVTKLETIICDVRDADTLNRAFKKYTPQIVFHAAAHKHVPLMELNPSEAIINNVFGTKNVAEAALANQSERFVFISTDKAVRPTSVMGASKRAAEMVVDHLVGLGETKFISVRFGNVLGSRGSVVPVFLSQIENGGPVTVTDERMTRYFMIIPEAVELVLQSGSLGKGGEVFVLDMGEPVKIVEMARDLIRFSGFEPDVDIPLKFTGMRPGEKLYEELLTAEEGTIASRYEKLFIAQKRAVDEVTLEKMLHKLKILASQENIDNAEVIRTIMEATEKGKLVHPMPLSSDGAASQNSL